MCVIIYVPKGACIGRKKLKQCWEANPHGAGMMYPVDGNLIIKKGLMTFESVMEEYIQIRGKVDVVLHFRIATHGTISPENTHPFEVLPGLGVAHNGIIEGIPREENESDTAAFAKLLKGLPDGWLETPGIMALVDIIANHGNKLAFMRADGFLHFIGAGVKEHGCWFSNDHWKPRRATMGWLNDWWSNGTSNGAKTTYRYQQVAERCEFCGQTDNTTHQWKDNGMICASCRQSFGARESY